MGDIFDNLGKLWISYQGRKYSAEPYSFQKNKVVCLECGQEFKMLSPKHLKSHGLDSKGYRKKYGFTARQPLCAKALSEKRSSSGKERGIPDNLKKAIEARVKKKKP